MDQWLQVLFDNGDNIIAKEIEVVDTDTVELQWLEHLWDYENMFEIGVVRAIEGLL